MARLQLLLVVALGLLAIAATSGSTDLAPSTAPSDSNLSVLTPIATSPLPEDAAAPSEIYDVDAGDVGSPLGTHATEPDKAGASLGGATSVAAVVAMSAAGYFMF
ncbi:hypothetical protein OPV22_028863 [Ensete ventricosum]|uniref:Anther-specific protein BCP1 n=1 Tax=Ensete ventricosum TaxID=4639 RepID=A0AAV8Q9R3_ENSVE|nr:hypothetical protein OPV22_028863 [Ensete ventricosum]